MGCGTSVHVGIVTPALEDGCKRFVVPLGLSLTECATIAESYPGLTGGKDDLEPADICARFGVMHTTFAEKIFNVLRESSTFTVHNPISITKVKGRGGEGRVCVVCSAWCVWGFRGSGVGNEERRRDEVVGVRARMRTLFRA